jgi:hypothetical protein
VAAPGVLLADNFARATLLPWVVQAGNWTLSSGVLEGGPNTPSTYGQAYVTNTWTDFEAQAQIQLPAGAFGGGLAARLNQATGARYALWIYPEGTGGSSGAWKLLRFQAWEAFTVLQEGSLTGVGTNWHTLKLWCQGNRIQAYYDGALLADTTDGQPYLSGGLSVELWTDATGYVMSADDVQVTALTPDLSVAAVGIVPNASSQSAAVTFKGAPGGLYLVQATTNVAAPGSWVALSTNLAGGDGRWTVTDSPTSLPGRYYRAARP